MMHHAETQQAASSVGGDFGPTATSAWFVGALEGPLAAGLSQRSIWESPFCFHVAQTHPASCSRSHPPQYGASSRRVNLEATGGGAQLLDAPELLR